MEPAWDHDTLRAWFEARAGEAVAETDLLRAFSPDEDLFVDGAGLELFQKHFLLYRRLWLFDDELRLSTGHRLWIRGIRSTLLDPPPEGFCGWLNDEDGTYCLKASDEPLCARHRGPGLETNGLKSYYLDWSNLEGMTEERVKAMVDGFFRWMGNRDAINRALEVLGLDETADGTAIKARWRRLSLEHHPDRGGDAATFKKISAAWAALKSFAEEDSTSSC